jgi:hypothetical protein
LRSIRSSSLKMRVGPDLETLLELIWAAPLPRTALNAAMAFDDLP